MSIFNVKKRSQIEKVYGGVDVHLGLPWQWKIFALVMLPYIVVVLVVILFYHIWYEAFHFNTGKPFDWSPYEDI